MNDDHGLNSLVLLLTLADWGRVVAAPSVRLQPDDILSSLAFCSDEVVAVLLPHRKIVELRLQWELLELGISMAKNGSHDGLDWEYMVRERDILMSMREMLRKEALIRLTVKFDDGRTSRTIPIAWGGYGSEGSKWKRIFSCTCKLPHRTSSRDKDAYLP